MNEPASASMLLIVEIVMIIHFVAVEFKLDKIREEIKEVKKALWQQHNSPISE